MSSRPHQLFEPGNSKIVEPDHRVVSVNEIPELPFGSRIPHHSHPLSDQGREDVLGMTQSRTRKIVGWARVRFVIHGVTRIERKMGNFGGMKSGERAGPSPNKTRFLCLITCALKINPLPCELHLLSGVLTAGEKAGPRWSLNTSRRNTLSVCPTEYLRTVHHGQKRIFRGPFG